MGRTFILMQGGNEEGHNLAFQSAKRIAEEEYRRCNNKLFGSVYKYGFRGRYDLVDEEAYNFLANSELVLGTLGRNIEGLFFEKRGIDAQIQEEKPLRGLICADVYGLPTAYNEPVFWNLTQCTNQIVPRNFETMMFYQSFSALASQPLQTKNSPFQIIVDSGSDGKSLVRINPHPVEEDVKIQPILKKENWQEYYSFGDCPDEPFSIFPF